MSNNHHHRVAPFEQALGGARGGAAGAAPRGAQLAWSAALGHVDEDCASASNLLPGAAHHELSHHLAHAWSAAAQAPFDEGLVIVMDGMGEGYRAMAAARAARERGYTHDLDLAGGTDLRPPSGGGAGAGAGGGGACAHVPADIAARAPRRRTAGARASRRPLRARRAHGRGHASVAPVLKRWIEERRSPERHNHGFENMESLGAVCARRNRPSLATGTRAAR